MSQWSEILLSGCLVIGFETSFVLPASLATASAPVLRNLAHRRDTGEQQSIPRYLAWARYWPGVIPV
jgi:hypothetical protein